MARDDQKVTAVALSRTALAEMPAPWISHVARIAASIREEALQRAAGSARVRADVANRLRDPEFVIRFRSHLVWCIANALGVNDPQVRAVYEYEPWETWPDETGTGPSISPLLHLLAVTRSRSTTLPLFAAALDLALAAQLAELPCPLFAHHTSVLRVDLIPLEVIVRTLGNASFLSSHYLAPVKIWDRQP